MAVTLAQALLCTQDDIVKGVIDEFRKSSFIFDNIIFDDVVAPGGGGTLTYGYTRLITQPSAAFRAINVEYTPAVATKQRYTVDLVPFGGSFEIDRVLKNMGSRLSEIQLQLTQKIKAAKALFNNHFINGDTAVITESFDGVDKAITGSSTELNAAGTTIDLSTSIQVDANYKAFLDKIDDFLALLDGTPSFLGMNAKMKAKMIAVARRAGYYTRSENAFGKPVDNYAGIPLVDMGEKEASTDPVVATGATGETSLFAIRLGLDGVHAASQAGVAPIDSCMPDFSTTGAVKKGEVEMVATVVLKATKAAGVLRKIKVQ
jgi:hypothetical protein